MVRTIQSIRTEKIRVLRRQAAPPQFLAAGPLKDLRHAADGAPPQSLAVAVVCLAQSRLVSSCRVVSRSWLARDYPPVLSRCNRSPALGVSCWVGISRCFAL